jgi:hypothetical protein
MFLLLPSHVVDSLDRVNPSTRRPGVPPSRLDVQRNHLEHKKAMHLIDSMSIDQRRLDLETALRRRQQILLARGERVSFSGRIRRSIGSALVCVGERIRADAAADTAYHG